MCNRPSCLLLGVALAGSVLLPGCGDWTEPVSLKVKTAPEVPVPMPKAVNKPIVLPVDRTLTDSQGRSITATIIGRQSDSITIVRHSDGKRFDLPLDRLSPPDREQVAKLPLTPAPAEPVGRNPEPGGIVKLRKGALKELDREIEDISTQLNQTPSSIKMRSLNSALERLKGERARLEAEIADLERK